MDIYFVGLKSKSNEIQTVTYNNSDSLNSIKYNIFESDSNLHVGYIEGYIANESTFISVVRIDPNFQGKGIGFKAFNKVFQELNTNNTITKNCGTWHKDDEFSTCDDGMSTNLKVFKAELNNKSNLSECALKTLTGKQAKKLGFEMCEVIRNDETAVEVVWENTPIIAI